MKTVMTRSNGARAPALESDRIDAFGMEAEAICRYSVRFHN